MFSESLSVPEAARRIISTNRIYSQALELGIVNYTALAEQIKFEIENLIGSKVNINTIVVAIKRLADSLEKKKQERVVSHPASFAPARAKLSLTGSILDIDLEKDGQVVDTLSDLFQDSTGYNFFQTDNHFTVLAEDAEGIRDIIANVLNKFEGTLNEGLSKITIALSPSERDPYDVLSLVSGILYSNQIPIRSAFFAGSEMILVLRDKDAARAYDLIRMEIG